LAEPSLHNLSVFLAKELAPVNKIKTKNDSLNMSFLVKKELKIKIYFV
jgi:hypothetical protein